jgi:hypothetical protein
MNSVGRICRRALIAATATLAAALPLAAASGAFADVTNPTPQDMALCPTAFLDTVGSQPPWGNGGVCLHSVVSGGSIKLGSTSVPITIPGDTVDLGELVTNSNSGNDAIVTPTDGQLFKGPAQSVPGGLLGILSSSAVPAYLRGQLASDANGPGNAVTASVELAGPTTPSTDLDPTYTQVYINRSNILSEAGPGLAVPVKFHLHNPFLGSSCTLGSNSNPVALSLTDGTTSPLAPNHPISGGLASLGFFFGFTLVTLHDLVLVDNSFAVPAASGCGPAGSLDAAVNRKEGLPSAPGHNTVILDTNAENSLTCVPEMSPPCF